ncbi:Sec-independent protein translocase subunit TatA [Nocardioidaceae bacterium]|nr:Sec-independent protein translocase subunit TatA [Nocardioidaceae bacterium]
MNLGAQELIIIAIILVLLFGAKKLPELARGSGRALRIFKAETKGLHDDDDDRDDYDDAEQADRTRAIRQQPDTRRDDVLDAESDLESRPESRSTER